jgi:cytochrome c-type biogenesis protein CcmE
MYRDLFETAATDAWLWNPVPLGLIAVWAVIGVFGIALVVRLHHDHFGAKLGASLLAIGAAGLVLLCAAQRESATTYYRHVDEVVADAQTLRGKHLQVHGCVVPGSIERRLGTDDYRFRMKSLPPRPPADIQVRYTGLVPDTFHAGAEIVATGTLVGDGGLDVVPDGIMAKCPSKYEPGPDEGWRACADPRP